MISRECRSTVQIRDFYISIIIHIVLCDFCQSVVLSRCYGLIGRSVRAGKYDIDCFGFVSVIAIGGVRVQLAAVALHQHRPREHLGTRVVDYLFFDGFLFGVNGYLFRVNGHLFHDATIAAVLVPALRQGRERVDRQGVEDHDQGDEYRHQPLNSVHHL